MDREASGAELSAPRVDLYGLTQEKTVAVTAGNGRTRIPSYPTKPDSQVTASGISYKEPMPRKGCIGHKKKHRTAPSTAQNAKHLLANKSWYNDQECNVTLVYTATELIGELSKD